MAGPRMPWTARCYVLAHAGAIRTLDEAGREITLRTCSGRNRRLPLPARDPHRHASHRKAIRQLGVTVGVTVTPDQEAEQLPLILENLASGGPGGR